MAELASIRITVLGSGGVGKSCLTTRLVANQYVTDYLPTIEDMYRHNLEVDDQTVILNVLDTAGQDEYVTLRPQWMKHGEAFLLVFACDSRTSFAELQTFYHSILQHRREEAEDELYSDDDDDDDDGRNEDAAAAADADGSNREGAENMHQGLHPSLIPPMVIVCNKVDLPLESRVVSREEGQSLATQLGVGYIEASALQGLNCVEAFQELARRTLQRRESRKGKKKGTQNRFWCTIL